MRIGTGIKRETAEYKAKLEPVKKAIEAIEKPYRERLKEAKRGKARTGTEGCPGHS